MARAVLGVAARSAQTLVFVSLLLFGCRAAENPRGEGRGEPAFDELAGELAFRAPAGLVQGFEVEGTPVTLEGGHAVVRLEGRRFEPPRQVVAISRGEARHERPELAYVAAASALRSGDTEWMATCVAPERRAEVRRAGAPSGGGELELGGPDAVRLRAVVEHGERAWVLVSRLGADGDQRRAVGMRRSGERWVLDQDRNDPVELVVSRGYERGDWGRRLSRRPR